MAVGDVPPEASGWVRLTDTQISALHFLEQRVLDGKPRIFTTAPRGELRLWIDGVCEWDVPSNSPICGFGGVLFIGDKPVAWVAPLPADKAGKWAARVGKQQLVYECELLPYLISLQLWAPDVKGTNLLTFIDNDAARASLAKSFTRKEEGARIVYDAVSIEESLDVHKHSFFSSAYLPTSATSQMVPASPIRLKLRKGALKVGGGVVLALVVFTLLGRHGCVFSSIHALHGL